MFMKMNRGFTITEVIITLAITSILAAIAVPAFSDFVADNRIAAQTNEFITDLYYARTEAIKRNRARDSVQEFKRNCSATAMRYQRGFGLVSRLDRVCRFNTQRPTHN